MVEIKLTPQGFVPRPKKGGIKRPDPDYRAFTEAHRHALDEWLDRYDLNLRIFCDLACIKHSRFRSTLDRLMSRGCVLMHKSDLERVEAIWSNPPDKEALENVRKKDRRRGKETALPAEGRRVR